MDNLVKYMIRIVAIGLLVWFVLAFSFAFGIGLLSMAVNSDSVPCSHGGICQRQQSNPMVGGPPAQHIVKQAPEAWQTYLRMVPKDQE